MHDPTVPMSPDALPQQRLVAVRDLPPRPEGFEYHEADDDLPEGLDRYSEPDYALFLCQLEWAWSPMNNAIHAFYLEPCDQHWLLWIRWFDDDTLPWGWRWYLQGWAQRIPGVDDRTAAFHAIIDHWRGQKAEGYDPHHWINEEGEFNAADLEAIVRVVWPEARDDG